MRDHHALGRAGGARGVEDDGDVVGLALGDLGVQEAGSLLARQLVQCAQERLLIVTHSPGIIVKDVREPRALRLDLEELVHLLLVLDDGDGDLGVLQEQPHLLRRRVPVHRNGHAPQHLGRTDRPVEARPVVADDGEMVAALESQLGEAPGQRPDFRGHLRPGGGLPDAHVLLAHRRPLGPRAGVVQEQPGKRVQRGGFVHALLDTCSIGIPATISARTSAVERLKGPERKPPVQIPAAPVHWCEHHRERE